MWLDWLILLSGVMILIVLGRRNLWFALLTASLWLGFFNLPPLDIWNIFLQKVLTSENLLLAYAVAVIPLIGGVLQHTGIFTRMVDNLRMKRAVFLAAGPAFLGLLPIPGGALLSAPLVLRAGDDISNSHYAAINVWFRHLLTFIYPLASLLVCAQLAGLSAIKTMLYLIPGLLLLTLLGWFFLLRNIRGSLPSGNEKINRWAILQPILIIITAPVLHVLLRQFVPFLTDKTALAVSVTTSFVLALFAGKPGWREAGRIFRKMKPWVFFLLLIFIFFFRYIFEASGISSLVSDMNLSMPVVIVVLGALFGALTARVQVGISLLLPIFIVKFGENALTYPAFALMYFSVFQGYVISPLHPCVLVTLEFFGTSLKGFYRWFIFPGLITLGAAYLTASLMFQG